MATLMPCQLVNFINLRFHNRDTLSMPKDLCPFRSWSQSPCVVNGWIIYQVFSWKGYHVAGHKCNRFTDIHAWILCLIKPNINNSWAIAHSFSFFFCFFFSLPFFGFFRLEIYVIIPLDILFLRTAYITFEPPEGSGSRLCRGATCQEYFWYLSILGVL
jgi:hypothetical protein